MPGRAIQRHTIGLGLLAFVLASCASCTDLKLRRYRDDRFCEEYRYALGEEFIEVNGIRICYQERGDGPAVIILPGLLTSIDFWQRNVPVLAEEFHVVPVDVPGMGKSGKPDVSYELPRMCDQIIAFMDAKQIHRASFIGGSMGGHLALLMALDHPDRVDRIVLMGSTGAWPPPHLLLEIGLELLWREAPVTDFLRGRWPEIYALMFKHEAEMTQRIFRYQMATRAEPEGFAAEGRAATRAIRSIFHNSCRSRLKELRVPVLLIWGEEDRIHPPEDALYMRRHMSDARLVIVPDASHEVMVDQPEVFNRSVTAFLEHGTAGVADSIVQKTQGY